MFFTKGLTFSYNQTTPFRFADMHADAGNALLITGKSGVGKTTLLHLLGGLLKPQTGQVVVKDTDIARLSGSKLDQFRGANIGIVFQQSHFVESLTVLDNVMLAASLAGKTPDRADAMRLLQSLDIAGHAAKKPAKLSQGQQQRANIARALINRPALLLADEPTSNLDDDNTAMVANLLSELAEAYKAALVIVTHDQRLKNRYTTSIEL